ncbi:Hypothetical predicted protein [Mytilus galloprovincialis]|uniref:Reverse transcriptase domain-containing protein n=1 Tax=Mytilus galloprovincialis TaxID=29158 RepID=A0A8B6EJ12_MYTGA|nr:Hypothetical predicted protein [Mytilus galloprovincialis]
MRHCIATQTKEKRNSNLRYKLNQIPLDFMTSDIQRSALLTLIENIERCRETQDNIDKIYNELCEIIFSEMNDKIPKFEDNSSKKRYKHRKPYWNDNLMSLWNKMSIKEKEFTHCKGNRNTRASLRNSYIQARDIFDKTLRRTERTYRKMKAVDIEAMTTKKPNDFWEKIRNLGPRNHKSIPIEIVDESGNIETDEQLVLDKWRIDFENLYTGSNSDEFDYEHYRTVMSHKYLLETNMEDPLFIQNEYLNRNITLDEIHDIVMHSKSKSASGFDEIPYIVLKFPIVIETILKLFQLILDTSLIPSIWRKSVICPILKDPSSDARMPMNYRGVSLLSCISKLYSAFMNKRITFYLENEDILADEQNGFRKDRSCEDHIYTLNSIVRNNKSLFVAFIDLRKCFDFIDRDMMLYKLLKNNIDGKLYNSIKSIYQNSESCVRLNGKLTSWFDCVGIDLADKNLSVLLYADDIALIAKSELDLQCMLDKLHRWCKQWRVLINTDKSKCIHFRNGKSKQTEYNFSVGRNSLEIVNQYKYLGVTFSYNGSFFIKCGNTC